MMQDDPRETQVDCLIVGGGPAGLTAAIYAARFRLEVVVVDAGASRAALIPCTHNQAGFPGGISGQDLLQRMRQQAMRYGAELRTGQVRRLEKTEGGFAAHGADAPITARAVLLATGVTNRRPAMPDTLHDQALAAGKLRYCPVCDGYEVTDQSVAVIGEGEHGVREACFLRSFTRRVTLVSPRGKPELTPDQQVRLDEAGIASLGGPATGFAIENDKLVFSTSEGRVGFWTVYPALGSDVHSDLARDLGADLTDVGCIKVDAHQRTSVDGLYAAGDVVIGLDQISHAMGEAGVAITTLRNDLAESRPIRR